jgi:replicative DNA helicase
VNKEQVSLVCLAHLNREAAKSGARVDQVKEFDDMLGDVDGMALLDSKIDPSTLSAGADWPMQFVVGKNRNGPSVRWDVLFNRRWMQFEEPPLNPLPVSRKR